MAVSVQFVGGRILQWSRAFAAVAQVRSGRLRCWIVGVVGLSKCTNGVGEGGIGLSWPQDRLSIGCDGSVVTHVGVLRGERTSRCPWSIPRHYSTLLTE